MNKIRHCVRIYQNGGKRDKDGTRLEAINLLWANLSLEL